AIFFEEELGFGIGIFEEASAFRAGGFLVGGESGESEKRDKDDGSTFVHNQWSVVVADAGVPSGCSIKAVGISEPSAGLRFRSIHSYRTGSRTRVRKVELTMPPMTTVARGRWTSAPEPVARAMGRKPRLATRAVMSTGRRRV